MTEKAAIVDWLSGDMKLSIYAFSVSILSETTSRAQYYTHSDEHELDHIKTRGQLRVLVLSVSGKPLSDHCMNGK